jgi:hypothetical protein
MLAHAPRQKGIICPLGKGFRCRQEPAFTKILSICQGDTNDHYDFRRHFGGGETVLTAARCQCKVISALA